MTEIILPFNYKKKARTPYEQRAEMHYDRIDANVAKMRGIDKDLSVPDARMLALWQEVVHNRILLDKLFEHFGVKQDE